MCLSLCELYVLYMCLYMLLHNIAFVACFINDEHQILERHCLTCHSHTSAIDHAT